MMKINFIDAENLSLVLTTLDTELGLAQPQLVLNFSHCHWMYEVFFRGDEVMHRNEDIR